MSNDQIEEFDIVIVGAGITGAMVAKTLVDKGGEHVKKILILEAGQATGNTAEGYRSFLDKYYHETAKVPNAPYPDSKNAPQGDVLNLKPSTTSYPIVGDSLVQTGPTQFLSDYAVVKGGTTLHWLGTCLRMLPNDFNMQSTYGHGVDWPINYEDLKPYYEKAEKEIGVAGEASEQHYPNMGNDYFGKDYVFPMKKIPQSYLDQKFEEGLNGLEVHVSGQSDPIAVELESTPQGRNSTPNKQYRDENGKAFIPVGMVGDPNSGKRCEGNSSCVPICPVQAKYNALKTLNAITETKLEVRSQSVASQIYIDSSTQKVSGIEYKHYTNPESTEYTTKTVKAKIYVLAAHAINNAKLLLASNAANSSDQVGRNLMDHLCLLTWGYMPENVGAYRGPGSTSGIPAFRDGEFRRNHSAFRVELGNWGWSWPAFSPSSDVLRYIKRDRLFGRALRERLATNLPRQFRIAWQPEQMPDPENRVTIDPKYRDGLGNHKAVISYHLSNYTKAAVAAGKAVSDQVYRHLGVEDHTVYSPTDSGYFEYKGKPYTVNGAGHVVGTHRMGDSKENSVVDWRQRCWDHENLYLVGCGNMATLGTSNPTLTAAALSIWAAENMIEDLQQGAPS